MIIDKVEIEDETVELPRQIIFATQEMDRMTFALAFKNRSELFDQFFENVDNKEAALHFSNEIDKLFKAEKKRRGIVEIDTNIA